MTHKYFQMIVKGNFSGLLVLNKKVEGLFGIRCESSNGHVVSCKKLMNEDLHTFKGMIGYYMKDNGEDHFEFVHHNVWADGIYDGKMEHAKCSKVGSNNRVNLCHSNVLQYAHQWAHSHMKKYLGVTLAGNFIPHMQKCQFYPNPTW